jgi:hypothetical protein
MKQHYLSIYLSIYSIDQMSVGKMAFVQKILVSLKSKWRYINSPNFLLTGQVS